MLASTPSVRVAAGCTDIIPQARAGRPLPPLLVDIKRIPRLTDLNEGEEWVVGAAAPAARVVSDEAFRGAFPGLAEGFALIGSDQIQSRASLGGNLCNASPAADTGPSMIVNGARAVIASPSGTRAIPVSELMVGPGRTSLAEGEFVVEFRLDAPRPRQADAYLRFTPRTEMDIAVVGAAARVSLDESGACDDVSVTLGAVGPRVVSVPGISEALAGRRIDDDALEEAAALGRSVCNPIDDKRGTIEYRTHLAGVLTKRAIRLATARAGGER